MTEVVVAAWLTTCGAAESSPLLAWKLPSPPYEAEIVWLPTDSPDVLKVAAPVPSSVTPAARTVEPSWKSTVPDGVPGAPLALIVAVSVTAWPNTDGFGEELTDVVVVVKPGASSGLIQVPQRLAEPNCTVPVGAAYSWIVQMVRSSEGSKLV